VKDETHSSRGNRRERRLSEAKDEGRDDVREGGKFGDTERERERNVSISRYTRFRIQL